MGSGNDTVANRRRCERVDLSGEQCSDCFRLILEHNDPRIAHTCRLCGAKLYLPWNDSEPRIALRRHRLIARQCLRISAMYYKAIAQGPDRRAESDMPGTFSRRKNRHVHIPATLLHPRQELFERCQLILDGGADRSKHHFGQFDVRARRRLIVAGPVERRLLYVGDSYFHDCTHLIYLQVNVPTICRTVWYFSRTSIARISVSSRACSV